MAVRLTKTLNPLSKTPNLSSLSFCSQPLNPNPTPLNPNPSTTQDLTNSICRILSDNRGPHGNLSLSLLPFSLSLSSNPSLITSIFRRTGHLQSTSLKFFLFLSSLPSSPSPLTHEHFSLLFASLSRKPSFLPHFSSLLFSYRSLVSPPLFGHIFAAYCRYEFPSDAIRVFGLMGDLGFKPDLTDLHSLFLSLCKYGFVAQAEQFFHEVRTQFEITVQTYTILINGWGRIRDSKRARKLFDEMIERGFNADLPAFNSLLASLCRSGQVGPAQELLKEMQLVHKLVPDSATYSVFIRTATEAKDLNSAIRVLDRMKRRGLTPNTFTYNTIIKLLCESEKTEDAYKLLNEMLETDSKPDTWTYNSILAVHCKLKEINRALRLIDRMDKDSCSPDQHSYNMLLTTLIHVGRIDKAEELFEGMEKRRFYPPCSTYAVMIHGLCRKRGRAKTEMEIACKYFERMVDEGIPPYESTCEVLRERLLRARERERLEVVLDRMRRSGSCAILELCSVMEGRKREGEKKSEEFEFNEMDFVRKSA